MNINRHNYEEYFLLYTDNELSAAEKRAVDVFVQQNPDLHKELFFLQQSVLRDDDIVFTNKEGLMRPEGFAELQEKLLLYTDDELSAAESQEMEKLLATDVIAAAEWSLLRQTKLKPDAAIVFADKASLYRTEGGRLVGFKWWRIAAAAVLLGFGIWIGTAIQKNSGILAGTGTGIAKEDKKQQEQNTAFIPVDSIIVEQPPVRPGITRTMAVTNRQKNSPASVNEKNDLPVAKVVKQKPLAEKESISVFNEKINNKKPDNNLPKPLENINSTNSNKSSIASVQPIVVEKGNLSGKNDIAVNKKDKPDEIVKPVPDKSVVQPANEYAKNAVYNPDAADNNDTRILYMDEENVKRTKIGGLFRKLRRVIERATNVKTGNGLKVAGFEIAVK